MNKRQAGYGMAEYILGVGILVGILFVPIPTAPFNGVSLSQFLVNAVKTEHSAYIYAASLPYLPELPNVPKKKEKFIKKTKESKLPVFDI